MANPYRNGALSSGGALASFSRFWHSSYASDYLGFFALLIGYLLIQFFVEPFHRMFAINDLRISFPHAEVERVPLTLVFVYAVFIPLLILVVFNSATRASRHQHHVTYLGLAITLILAAFITDLIKNLVGRPRPDLIARCKPTADTPRDTLVTIAVCTESAHHVLHDGWRSFPSGHSSFSFAGLGHLSLFFAGQLRIFAHGRGPAYEKLVRGDLGRALVCLAPLLAATWIAISRCQDYRHDVYDVCIGSLLGWVVAYWGYRRYWPRLGGVRCHEPHPRPPGGDSEGGLYGRVGDEEEALGGQNVGFELRHSRSSPATAAKNTDSALLPSI